MRIVGSDNPPTDVLGLGIEPYDLDGVADVDLATSNHPGVQRKHPPEVRSDAAEYVEVLLPALGVDAGDDASATN